jgi:hypothetical protein
MMFVSLVETIETLLPYSYYLWSLPLAMIYTKRDNRYQRDKKRKLCKRRAAIEPIIGHLKSDFRLSRNLLKGQVGDEINVLMRNPLFTHLAISLNPALALLGQGLKKSPSG